MARTRVGGGRTLLLAVVAAVLAACGGAAPARPTASPLPQGSAGVTTPAPTPARLPSFDRNEPLLLFARLTGAGGGIFVMRPDGSGEAQLATDVLPGVHKHPDWSPDGQDVVFIDEATERMWIAHLDGTPTTSVPACDTPGCDYPAFSPDGSRIAFSRYENGGFVGPAAVGVYIVDLASGAVSPVVRLERPLLADVPRWSADGSQLVIGVDRMDDEAHETGAAIAVVPVGGGEPIFLTEFETFGYSPDWTWVSGEIVFSPAIRDQMKDFDPSGETWNVFGLQPDASGLRQISNVPKGELLRGPRWLADGTAIVAYDLTTTQSVLVDPQTGALTPLLVPGLETRPLFRPIPAS